MDADMIVVGAGILGLAHALAARRAGLSVLVVERDAQANGASIRNFGFVTVTGQGFPDTHRRAARSRDIWAEIAPAAGIAMHHRGLLMACRRPEAVAVAEAFCAGPMGASCRMLTKLPPIFGEGVLAALYSPHELRVESREAIAQLAAWLEHGMGVRFLRRTAVRGVADGLVETTSGTFRAPKIVVCPGTDLATLFPEVFAARQTTLCKLHMLKLVDPGWELPAAVMSDLGMVRYLGYRHETPLAPLRARLEAEQADALEHGVHLIVVQNRDGSLVVGDSHHYAATPDPFQPGFVDDIILAEFAAVFGAVPPVIERWVGVYPSGPQDTFTEHLGPGLRLVSVTSGTGASTSFAIAEETMESFA
ncbi:FAD dependent oxidoreductase TIGR03364 [Humitalea rosea]|uniref:FAD dependent oxidoreductase TIGR03364 n=1 Tax=Humitalea rosea TaxID=990373 RepID=A0A2W7IRM3_9PROT|nr:TIGR03364 family FAD-dependent oxidoreductase [Humitalea rosea]PZW48141.1 FAD dependent oxidoreductase TIGR03364 [Humitalea rosea]